MKFGVLQDFPSVNCDAVSRLRPSAHKSDFSRSWWKYESLDYERPRHILYFSNIVQLNSENRTLLHSRGQHLALGRAGHALLADDSDSEVIKSDFVKQMTNVAMVLLCMAIVTGAKYYQ